MNHITILTYEHCWAMNVMIVNDFFSIVQRLQSYHHQAQSYVCQIVSFDGNTITSASDNVLNVDTSMSEIKTTDLIVIPPIVGDRLGSKINGKEEIIQWLKEHNSKSTPIVSVSTGAFLLGDAGLLNNKLIATHWAFIKYFQTTYPLTHFMSNKSYTLSENIYSTGTFDGCMDVLLQFITQTQGDSFAQQCAAHSLLTSPESITPVLLGKRNHSDQDISKVQDWIEDNYNKTFSILALAKKFSFSERNLKRRFKIATEISPIQYLQQVRLEKAKKLLIATERTVSEIAYAVGYENKSFFIRLFKRHLGVTPKQWRSK